LYCSLGFRAYFKLSEILLEAEKTFKAALQIDDSSSTIHEHLGDATVNRENQTRKKAARQKSPDF